MADSANKKDKHGVITDALTLPSVDLQNGPVTDKVVQVGSFHHRLLQRSSLFLDQHGNAYVAMNRSGNPYVYRVGSKQLNNVLRKHAAREGVKLRPPEMMEFNQTLQSEAELTGITKKVWSRVAPVPNGVEIDLGDESHTRVRISGGKVEIITEGSDTLFYRSPVSQPMVMPAEIGNLKLLRKYLNISATDELLLIAWLSYTLAHPKESKSRYVILVLQGEQGAGKSWLCKNIIIPLIDPSHVGVQIMPSNPKDFAIAAQSGHVLCYDNVRGFTLAMSDLLCVAATGGTLNTRRLFTDDEQNVLRVHVALVLNGIHSFVEQPDLAQRCLHIQLRPLSTDRRQSEEELSKSLQEDLPAILRGLFDRIAQIFTQLPHAKVTDPERMLDFVQWLAAMEMVDGTPPGIYQQVYSEAINQGQLDSLLDNILAAEVLAFAEALSSGDWSGSPTELLSALNARVTWEAQRSREWPGNAIALSKRLSPLAASLRTQGISVEFTRGKHRTISITREGAQHG